jgi:hypothetical protein
MVADNIRSFQEITRRWMELCCNMFLDRLLNLLMAKRNTGCVLWGGLGNARTAGWMPALLALLFAGDILRAADSV